MGEKTETYFDTDEHILLRTADVYQTENDIGTVGYSDTLLSVVATFKNGGAPEGFNAQSMVGKSKRGEVALRLFAVIDPTDERIVKVGFKSRGCLAMTACASMICIMVEGKTFTQALAISGDELREALDGVPRGLGHTVYFALEGIRALIGDYLIQQGATIDDLEKKNLCTTNTTACVLCEHCSLRDSRLELLFAQQ